MTGLANMLGKTRTEEGGHSVFRFAKGFAYPASSLSDLALGRVAENFVLPRS